LSDRKTIFQALSHPLRQRVVSMLSEESRTYTYLLETLGVESGHLAYHLRHLGDVVEKDEDGLYTLTKLGWEAYRFMEHERPPEEEKPVSFPVLMVYGVALILVIIMSSSAVIFTSTTIDPTALYLEESLELIDRSFEVIYEIFEQRYIGRSTWTDMTITLIKLQDRLERLEESSGVDYSETEELAQIIEAFTTVMGTPDSLFPEATVENRPLIRDYHFILVQLKPRLENM
jgi:hypothetical protein